MALEALHLHDLQSVNKHDDFGIWFTAMPAGYVFARSAELGAFGISALGIRFRLWRASRLCYTSTARPAPLAVPTAALSSSVP